MHKELILQSPGNNNEVLTSDGNGGIIAEGNLTFSTSNLSIKGASGTDGELNIYRDGANGVKIQGNGADNTDFTFQGDTGTNFGKFKFISKTPGWYNNRM